MTIDRRTDLTVSFEGLPRAEANRVALELRDQIVRAVDGAADVTVVRDRDDTQDLGTTLEIVLSAPAATILAKAVHSFIAKRGHRVVIRTRTGTVVATGSGAANIDVARTVEAMNHATDG